MKNILLKLAATLIVFGLITITVMTLTTRYILVNDILEEQKVLRATIEDNIVQDLTEMDKAHRIFQEIESEDMEKGLRELHAYYNTNKDVYAWDLEAIAAAYPSMDFYVLNNEGEVVVTTHAPSENMDFKQCCTQFVSLIQERIVTDDFYFDGLEISVAEGTQNMYSYLATADHRYLLEFGVNFDETEVAKEFNYEDTVLQLTSTHHDLHALYILTHDGFVLNRTDDLATYTELDKELQQAFLQTVETGKPTTVTRELADNKKEDHRFITYHADEARGNATHRIIYMKYENVSEVALMQKNTVQFWLMALSGVLTTAILLLVILKLFNKTIRLATYDPLTGAYNRASYLQRMDELIASRKQFPIGLLLIDLDHFKTINDTLGHAEGDAVLRQTTTMLLDVAQKAGYVVRFGGDEFAIVYERATKDQLAQQAEALLTGMRHLRAQANDKHWQLLSMSIGATIQQEPMEEEAALFKRADQALYMSKHNGKDRYTYLAPPTIEKRELSTQNANV